MTIEIEESINFLKGYLDEEVYTEKCRNAHKMAIKALEQESIIDKIRAEIEQVSFTHNFEYGEYYGEDTRQERIVNFNSVTQIIDKYKEGDE